MAECVVLVVDDEVKVTQIVEAYLLKDGFRVAVAHDGDAAVDLFFEVDPSLVILDLNLPKLSGEEVCRFIRTQSRVPIIMLTANSGEASAVAGLDLGADDYMSKPFSARELMARVRALLRRSSDGVVAAKPVTVCAGELLVDSARHEARVSGVPVSLTAKEFALLHPLASHPGTVLTRAQLAEAIGGGSYEGSDRTIDSHSRNPRTKIEPTPMKPRYIRTVFGVGYRADA